MEIDRDAPVQARRDAEVSAPASAVWDVLTTVGDWPRWNGEVKSATMAGPIARGATFRWKAGPATIKSTVEEFEPPQRLAWTGRTFGLSAIHTWRLDAREGGTRVTTEESMDGLLARLLRPMIQKNVDKSLNAWLRDLQSEAESRPR